MEADNYSPLVDRLLTTIPQAANLYHRLVIVVVADSQGASTLLEQLHARAGYPLLNVSLEVSQRLLELPEPLRPLRVGRVLDDLLVETNSNVVLLDRLALLFEPSLRQNALSLLKQVARDRTIVGGWTGTVEGKQLVYAEPDHPEYDRFDASGVLVVHESTM